MGHKCRFCRIFLFISLFLISFNAGAQQEHSLQINIPDTANLLAYADFCLERTRDLNKSQDSAALFYGNEALRSYIKVHNVLGAVRSMLNYGTALMFNNYLEKAEPLFINGVQAAALLHDRSLVVKFDNALGSYYCLAGSYPKAISWYHRCIENMNHDSDKYMYVQVVGNLGTLYSEMDDTLNAIKNLEIAYNGSKALNTLNDNATVLLMLSQLYAMNGEFDKSLKTAKELLIISESTGDLSTQCDAWYCMGIALFHPGGDYREAIKDFKKSADIALALNSGSGQEVSPYLSIGAVYGVLSDYREALVWDKAGLAAARKYQVTEGICKALLQISEHSRGLNDYKAADSFYRLYVALDDSFNAANPQHAIVKEEARFTAQQRHVIDSTNAAFSRNGLVGKMDSQRTTAFIVVGILLISGLVAGFLIRIQQIKNKSRLSADFQKRVSELELQALRAQMNPHFIFNSLNTIDSYVLQNRQEDASKLVNRFSKLTRRILEQTKESYISVEQELETLRIYLQIEQIRKNNTFDFTIEAEPQLINYAIPPMLLQPFVENAVLHGMMESSTRQGNIKVEITDADPMIRIIIEDNGIGRHKAMELKMARPESHRSISMELTQNRLISLHGHKRHEEFIRFTDFYGEATGTRVEIFLPKKKLENA